MSYELLAKFTEFVVPSEMKNLPIPKNELKMMMFAQQEQITNENIDYWMAIKPERQQDELFVDYKDRQKFQKALLKYRPYIYDYSQLETK